MLSTDDMYNPQAVENIRLLEVFTQARLRLGLPALSLFRLFSRTHAVPSSLVGLLNSRSPRSPLLASLEDDAQTPAPSTPLAPPPRRQRRPRTADSRPEQTFGSSPLADDVQIRAPPGLRIDDRLRSPLKDGLEHGHEVNTSPKAASDKFTASRSYKQPVSKTSSLSSVTTQNTISSFECAGLVSDSDFGDEAEGDRVPRESPSDNILLSLNLHMDTSSALHARRKQRLVEAG